MKNMSPIDEGKDVITGEYGDKNFAPKNHTHNYAGSTSPGGPATTAKKLETACKINGVSFDGTADIKIPRSVKPIARIDGTAGTSGYFKIASISITGNYVNTPIMLSYIQRSGKEATLYICFNSVANIDPTLAGFRGRSIRNQNIDAYIHKSAASTWDIYVKKVEAYDVLFITDCQIRNDGTNIYFDNDQVSALPEGAVKALSAVYMSASSTGGELLYDGAILNTSGQVSIPDLANCSVILINLNGAASAGLKYGVSAVIPISYLSKSVANKYRIYGGIPSASYMTSDGPQAAKNMEGYITVFMPDRNTLDLTMDSSGSAIGNIQIYSVF